MGQQFLEEFVLLRPDIDGEGLLHFGCEQEKYGQAWFVWQCNGWLQDKVLARAGAGGAGVGVGVAENGGSNLNVDAADHDNELIMRKLFPSNI